MIIKLYNVVMVQVVHDLDFKFNLLNKIVFYDFCFIYDFYGIDIFGCFVAYLVYFAKAAYTDV